MAAARATTATIAAQATAMTMNPSHDISLRRRHGRNPTKNNAARIAPEFALFRAGFDELVIVVVETVRVVFRGDAVDTLACCGLRVHAGESVAFPEPW
jgi:hypothetical protein